MILNLKTTIVYLMGLLVLLLIGFLLPRPPAQAVHFQAYDFRSIRMSPDPPLRQVPVNGIATFDVTMEAVRPPVSENLVIGYWLWERSHITGNQVRTLDPAPPRSEFGGDIVGGSRCNTQTDQNALCLRPGETTSSHTVRLQFPSQRVWHLFLRVELYRGYIDVGTWNNFVRGCFIPIAVEVGNPQRDNFTGSAFRVTGPTLYNNITMNPGGRIVTGKAAGAREPTCDGDEVTKLQLYVAGELSLGAFGTIEASGAGHHGGRGHGERGAGPGGGENAGKIDQCETANLNGGGGAHGGRGRRAAGGTATGVQRPPYGDPNLPLTYGSGGGGGHRDYRRFLDCDHFNFYGGDGGGAIFVKARRVRLGRDAVIRADGTRGDYRTSYHASGGGGSGGSVAILAEESFYSERCGVSVEPGWNDISHWPQGQERGTIVTNPAGREQRIGGITAHGGGWGPTNPGGGGGGRIYVQAPTPEVINCGKEITITANPTSATVPRGQNAVFDLTVCLRPLEGSESADISLGASPQAGVTASLSTTRVTRVAGTPCGNPAQNPRLTVDTSTAQVGRTYNVTVTGTNLNPAFEVVPGTVIVPVTVTSGQDPSGNLSKIVTSGSTTVRPGDRVTFQITYSANRNGHTEVLTGCGGGGWARIIDDPPAGFNFTPPATPAHSQLDCPRPRAIVWDQTRLGSGDTLSGIITFVTEVSAAACDAGSRTVRNVATMELARTGGSIVVINPATVDLNLRCPITVTGNVSSAGGSISQSSQLKVRAPSVVTAAGNIGITRETGVTFLENYTVNTSSWRSVMTRITQRLLREIARPCNFSIPLNGVCKVSGPVIVSGITGQGTIIVDGGGPVTIGNISNASIGIIVNRSNPVNITGSSISSIAVYAPDSVIDFGSTSRNLALRGIFIARQFNNLSSHSGNIDYDSSLLRNPPTGLGQILAPLVKELVP